MFNSNDADLVKRAQGGDVDAVGELYDRHHESIFRYVQSRVYDRDLAEDLTGEIFTRMVTSLPGYRLRGIPFRAWLYRIARNLVVDHYRKESGRVSVPLYHAESAGARRIASGWANDCRRKLNGRRQPEGWMDGPFPGGTNGTRTRPT